MTHAPRLIEQHTIIGKLNMALHSRRQFIYRDSGSDCWRISDINKDPPVLDLDALAREFGLLGRGERVVP